MSEMQPNEKNRDVVVVTSRREGPGTRSFQVEAAADAEAPELPPDLRHESDLVELMRKAGLRLTMVGGGSRPDEVRRFYFRPGGRE